MQAQLAAGTTLKAVASLPDYPASAGWVLSYRLTPAAAGPAITFVASASGDDHAVLVPRGTTANWAPGVYTVTAWVDKGAERYSVDSEGGRITVTPDPANLTAGTDLRSQSEIALAAVQSLLAGKAASGTAEYTINGRQLKSYSLAELMRLEAKLKADVDRERIAAGQQPQHGAGRIRRILTRCV